MGPTCRPLKPAREPHHLELVDGADFDVELVGHVVEREAALEPNADAREGRQPVQEVSARERCSSLSARPRCSRATLRPRSSVR